MKDSKCTSALGQVMGNSKARKPQAPKERTQASPAHSVGNMGMMDKEKTQINGYTMAESDGRGNY